MQIVIDIPEELKNKIDNANEDNYKTYLWWFETTLYCAIKNGTPLPKGHGDLKDMGNLQYVFDLTREDTIYSGKDIERAIKSMKTIIEADKEYEVEVVTRGNCMMCGKELTEGLFFCKECGDKANGRK